MSAAELAGGFGRPGTGSIEDEFQRQLEPLPAATRRLLQLAAADPVGEPLLVWRAAAQLGIDPHAATSAVDAACWRSAPRCGSVTRACSAAYRSASPEERHALHAALAQATDPQLDPDRRAWHRAQAMPAPMSRSPRSWNGRPAARWPRGHRGRRGIPRERGHAHAGAHRRARRLLAAARAGDAGALDAALELLAAVEAGPVDALQAAEIEQLRGEIAFDQRRVREAARLLVSAAWRLDSLDAELARTTHLKALGAAMWAGPDGLLEAAEAARAAPPGRTRRGRWICWWTPSRSG